MRNDFIIPLNILDSNKAETEKNIKWLKDFIIPSTNKMLSLLGMLCWFGAGYFKAEQHISVFFLIVGIVFIIFELTIKKRLKK